jgi:hypothetical protein
MPIAMRIKIRKDGTSIALALDGIRARLKDLTPALERSVTRIQHAYSVIFKASGGHFGATTGWPPLSPKYAKWKSRRAPGAPLLILTGKLRDSLTRKNAPGAIRVIDQKGLLFGTGVSVGKWNLYQIHSEGLPPVPRRDPTPSEEGVARIVYREILRHLHWSMF